MTRGNFYYDFNHNGWVLNEVVRNRPDMPILVLVGADDYYFNWIDEMVTAVINGTADEVTRAFLQANGTPTQPANDWAARPAEFREGGAVVVFDFQYYESPEGGSNIGNGIAHPSVTGVTGAEERIGVDDNWWNTYTVDGATVHQQFSERWWVSPTGRARIGRQNADLIIRINGLVAINFDGPPDMVSAKYQEILREGVARPAASADGNTYIRLTDLRDSYFGSVGFLNLRDYLGFIRDHEILHSNRREGPTPQGGFAAGHGGFWTSVFAHNAPATQAASIQVRPEWMLTDTIEGEILRRRINAGLYYRTPGVEKASREAFDDIPADILALFPADRRNRESINVPRLLGFLEYRRDSLQALLEEGIMRWKAQYRREHPGVAVPEPTLDQLASGGYLRDPGGSTALPARVEELRRTDFFDLAGYAVDRLLNSVIDLDGGQLGLALGSALGKRLSSNPFGQIVASGTLSSVLGAAGEFIDRNLGGTPSTNIIGAGLEGFGDNLLQNIKGAGIGALSSLLTAELVDALGIDGVPGEVANSVGGSVVTQILNNIPLFGDPIRNLNGDVIGHHGLFDGIGPGLIASAAASYLGGKLASEIYSPQNVGGQIGSAVGSAYGGWVASTILASGLNPATFAAAVVAVAMWQVIGGLAGSVFGGTSRSGADVAWDPTQSEFVVANVYARKGASKDAAKSFAEAVAGTFNSVLSASGATLLDPSSVQSGNYGMRSKDYVYRPVATRDKDIITARFVGKDGANQLITHGTFLGLSTMIRQMAGGNIYVKRAIAASLSNAGGQPESNAVGAAGDFRVETLLGDVAIAFDYTTYVSNSLVINGLIAAQPASAFAAGWLATLARANELGMQRRGATDWIGGYEVFFDEAPDGATGGDALIPAQLTMGFDQSIGARYWSINDVAGEFLGYIDDTIEFGSTAEIRGGAGDDLIVLSAMELSAPSGSTNAGLTINGEEHNGSARYIEVAATIEAGDGDDFVQSSDRGDNVFGGAGNDTLYGGRLDDWLLGGEGDDILHAGSQAGGLGGDGNYLDGGAGDDQVFGREGSDWLEGGDGADLLDGGGGDDILTGGGDGVLADGTVAGDTLKGGHGGDQYLLRIGDGADLADESAAGAVLGNGAAAGTDRVKARFAGIALGTIARNWRGDDFDRVVAQAVSTSAAPVVAAAGAGGEDAIVFGLGIGIGDIRLTRLGGANGADLLVEVIQEDADGAPALSASLRVSDWFADPFKRIEWLKFADGTEIRIGDFTSFVVGTASGDVIIGTEGNDFVYAGDGDDEIRLLAGNDVGIGAGGDDLVSGDDGRDMVIGATGADRLLGGRGEDTLSGDAGDDDLHAGADDDILSGGRGDDQMVGGAGDDLFKYARGDGRDTVFDAFGAFWTAIWSAESGWINGYVRNDVTGVVTGPDGAVVYGNVGTQDAPDYRWFGRFDYDVSRRADGSKAGILYRYDQGAADASAAGIVNLGTDTIEFAIGISIQDVILTRTSAASDDLVLTIASENAELSSHAAGADSITIRNWYASPGQIEKLAFYQTGILAIGGAGAVNIVAGTDANDGTMSAPLVGTVGADWITGGSGDDVVAGGSGDDIIAGNSGFDTLRGEGGKDVLYGGAGNDTLDGGLEGDKLFGGAGMDAASYASVGASFRAYLGFSWANTGSAAEGDEYDGIENLIGGSGSDGATLGDVLGGDEGDNEISGGRGNDILYGGAGDDSYLWNGADWNDTIREGAYSVEQVLDKAGTLAAGYAVEWNRTDAVRPDGGYYWRLAVTGPGGELVYENALYAPAAPNPPAPPPTAWDQNGWLAGFARSANGYQVLREKIDTGAEGGSDTIEFGAGITLADLSFERFSAAVRDDAAGADLIVRFQNSQTGLIRVENQYSASGAVETLLFRDGFSVSLSGLAVAAAGATLAGTEAGDFLVGAGGASGETLLGGLGNDVLSGLGGADILRGEGGDDVLEGGSGHDADTLDGGETDDEEAGDTVRYVRSTAVTIDLRLSSGQAGGDAAGDMLIGIENVVGSATGADVIDGDHGDNRLDGLDGDNVIRGWGGDDAIYAGAGADLLYGGDGIDALSGGEGGDQLWGDAGDDVIAGGAGDDSLYGGTGGDELIGGDGNDMVLDGGDGDDNILGEAGNDSLAGGGGKDLLVGGAGDDILLGGQGADEYLFEPGFSTDVLTDADGVNKLLFEGIPHDRIWLTQAGQDLRIGIVGTADVLTVSGFFAASASSRIRSIETNTHALFLDHEAVRGLIAPMSAASSSTPAAMPATVAAMLPGYWHVGRTAAPTASAPAPDLAGAEDTAIAFTGDWNVVDQDSDGLVYSVAPDGAAVHGTVAIDDPANGALTYTPHADFNGEDGFTLLVKDAAGHTLLIPVRVIVQARDDAPRALGVENGARLAIAEQSPTSATAAGSIVARLVATDPEGGAIGWSFASENGAPVDGGGRFTIDPDGLVVVADPGLLDHEADGGQPVRIRVRATDATGSATDQDFYVQIDDANEANSLNSIAAASVAEDAANGTAIGQAHALDIDAATSIFAQQRYFFLSGGEETGLSADGRFQIDALSGIVTTADALDFETAQDPLHYVIIARDNGGGEGALRSETAFTVSIGDANEQNRFAGRYEFALAEGIQGGASVGHVTALDYDAPTSGFAGQRYYFLSQNAASATSWDGRFSIDAGSGVISSNFAFDRESGPAEVVYRVLARDNGGGPGAKESATDVTIRVEDVNEANAIAPLYELSVGEDVPLGTVVAQVAANDVDTEGLNAQQDYAFEYGGIRSQTSSDGRFAIDRATGAISLVAQLDSETMTTADYGVVVRDRGGAAPYHEVSTLVRIAILDRNDPNRFDSSFAFEVQENGPRDTFVGTVTAQDEDRAGTAFAAQRYKFYDNGNESNVSPDGLFVIDPIQGHILTVGSLDHEHFPEGLTYQVVSRDNEGPEGGFRAVTNVSISIGDLNERPDVPAITAFTPAVGEGGQWSAQLSRSDPDGTTPELVFVSNPGSYFAISGGQLLFAGGSAPNFETLYELMFAEGTAELRDDDQDGLFELLIGASIKARDSGGLESAGALGLSVRIEDVNEAATSYAFQQSELEVPERDRPDPDDEANQSAVTIGILSIIDPDLAVLDTGSYTFTSSNSDFEIEGTTLRLKAGAALDFEAGPVVTLTVTAADGAGGAVLTKTISVGVKDEHDFLRGTEEADTLIGQRGRDRIWGQGGADMIIAGTGDDYVSGGSGGDDIDGGEGADDIHGDAGADLIAGGAGDDGLHGGDGLEQDRLYGGSGNDVLYGGTGDDILTGGDGSDALIGGEGDDTASYAERDRGAGAVEGVTVHLADPTLNMGGEALGDSYESIENLTGTEFADHLYGDGGRNTIDGGDGEDHLYGGFGVDTLDGGAGNDHLYAEEDDDILDGGIGDDELHGGSGADTYFMRRNSGADKIFEFNPEGASKDVLQFDSGNPSDAIEHHELWFELVDASGNPNPAGPNVKVSLLGTATSATIMNWQAGKRYQIKFISTGPDFTRDVNVGQLLALMSQKPKPVTAAAHLVMMDSDRAYWEQWANLWDTNEKPEIASASPIVVNIDEGQTAQLALTLSDDITPVPHITPRMDPASGIQGLVRQGLDANGNHLVTIVPEAHVSGTVQVSLRAVDGGNRVSDNGVTVTLNIRGLPTRPTLTAPPSVRGTSGEAGGIPITLNALFPDDDGSEFQRIAISGLPAGVTLNRPNLGSTPGTWLIAKDDRIGLAVIADEGFSTDFTLHATAYAEESGLTESSGTVSVSVAVNAPPTGASFTGAVIENSQPNAEVGTVSGSDPDGDPLQYFLTDPETSPFVLSTAGLLTVKTPGAFNYESAVAHLISVRVEENMSETANRRSSIFTLSVPVIDTNEQNSFIGNISATFAETVAVGTIVGRAQAVDPDTSTTPYGQQLYGFLVNNSLAAVSGDQRLVIDQVTGLIRTRTALNFETGSMLTYTVAARDNPGGTTFKQAEQSVSITLTDINEPNDFAVPTYSMGVLESASINHPVGTVTATDPDLPTRATGQQRYSFKHSSTVFSDISFDGRYKIDAVSGVISVNKALDHETMGAEVSYVVIARDNRGVAPYYEDSTEVKITVGNANEPNTFAIGAYGFEIAENTAPNVVVGTVAAHDPDGAVSVFGQQRYWFVVDLQGTRSDTTMDGRYKIDHEGKIRVNGPLNFEGAEASKTYDVIAWDNAGGSSHFAATTKVGIAIGDVNEQNALQPVPPGGFTVVENSKGALVGTISATDPDTALLTFAKQTYSFLVNNQVSQNSSDGRYTIDPNSGQIFTLEPLNHETMSAAVEYKVIARDNSGAAPSTSSTANIKIAVSNVAETPAAPAGPATAFFNELSPAALPPAGTVFATYALSDPDGPVPQLQFAPGGNLGGLFSISGGQLLFTGSTTLPGARFDYEWAKNGFATGDSNGDGRADAYIGEVRVQAADGTLTSGVATTLFYLSDVNERPNALSPPPQTLHSEMLPGDPAHSGNPIATFAMSDPDGTTPSLRIVGGNPHGWFTTVGGTLKFGTATFTASWLRAAAGQYGMDAGFYYDTDGDGLLEIRVATLTLAAVDAGGLESDPISYNVYIEDKNEAPAFAAPYTFALNENPAAFQQVGTIAATDPDGPAGSLRYYFAGAPGAYYNSTLGRHVSQSGDGRFVVDFLDGRVWVNGTQSLDFEALNSFAYQSVVYDRDMGANRLYAMGLVKVTLQDRNEPHALQNASFTVNEANVQLGPTTKVPTAAGTIINLKDAMLSDPEGHNMRWQFGNGSTQSGAWQIEQDGTLRMIAPVDYEALTYITEEQTMPDGSIRMVPGRDPSRAVVTLAVQAIDDATGVVKTATLTINVADVNEDVTTAPSPSFTDSGAVIVRGSNEFWIQGQVSEGRVLSVNAFDPEGRALTYSLTNMTTTEISPTAGGNNDIDSGLPVLSIDSTGKISFSLPYGSGGDKDTSWQGGAETSPYGRRTLSVQYDFNVQIADSVGRTIGIPYRITFLRRGASVPPVVFDLDGDGLELVAYDGSSVIFDMDGDGVRDVTGWVAADDGLLALDRNGDGLINDVSEISFRRDDDAALTDLEGLRAFDSNANGFLDAGDARWEEFKIWRDSDQDGVSQIGELTTLSEAGIVNVNLTVELTGSSPEHAVDNIVFGTTRYQRADGTTAAVGDVFLTFDPSDHTALAAPIVLDYDGDGSGLVSLAQSSALFDMDGDGDRERTGWFAAGDALLVLDRNGDGAISDIAEISFVGDTPGAMTDLEGLAAFDSDGDGVIATRDARYADFLLWFDNDGDAITGAGELLSLAEAGVASISLAGSLAAEAERLGPGNRIYARASFTRADGSAGTVLDAAFAYAAGPQGAVDHSSWSGHPTPSTETADNDAPLAPLAASTIAFQSRGFGRGSGQYRLAAQSGELAIGPSKPKGTADPRAGSLGPASMLSFANGKYGYLAPVILDLDGDGLEIQARKASRAYFDMDGNGSADDTGWIGRRDGFLVIDVDGDGRIEGSAELSLLSLKADAKNSFEALATLDSNKNGKIDALDARFGDLKLWIDRNGNGVTDKGELASLVDKGIASISLAAAATEQQQVKIGGNSLLATSIFTRADGSTGTLGSAALAFRPTRALAAQDFPQPRDAGADAVRLGAALRTLRSSVRSNGPLSSIERSMALAGDVGFSSLADPLTEAGDDRAALQAEPNAAMLDTPDPRLARLVQEIAAFGARSGDNGWSPRADAAPSRFDYYAA